MAEYKLSLVGRTVVGKKLNELRAKGLIPGVIYGGGKDPVMVESEYIATDKTLRAAGYASPINISVDGKAGLAMLKNVDIDPVKRTIRNVEFQAISADEVVEATTPVVVINFGGSPASVAKLSLLQVMEDVEIKAKPAALPKTLEVDGSALAKADEKLTLADVILPAGVEFVDKETELDEATVAVVTDPAAAAAAREAEDAAAEAAGPVDAANVPSEAGEKPEEAAPAAE